MPAKVLSVIRFIVLNLKQEIILVSLLTKIYGRYMVGVYVYSPLN